PLLPLGWGAGLLILLLAGLGIAFWTSTTNLEGHVRAGAEVVLEALERQRHPDEEHTRELEVLLPGLGNITPIRIAPESDAVGSSLGELELRGLTGATILAIHRPGHDVITPKDAEVLRADDVVLISGSHEAVEAARDLLGQPG
ncbi:MAG: cation:proton antiporter regulatory subunit, partial [Myxococcota bacterium]